MANIASILGLTKSAVAIAFLDSPPADLVPYRRNEVPAGCNFWALAAAGEAFYTAPAQHYNCAVGSYTHKFDLPPERGSQLMDTVGLMVSNGYIRQEEIPGIPVLDKPPAAVAYAPVEQSSFRPDVVIVALKPAQAMLLYEAAVRAGLGGAAMSALGRPACAVLPHALRTGTATLSFGCKGNRTFTGISDDELYMAIPGSKWAAVVEQVAVVARANEAMSAYYSNQKARFPILP